MEAIKLAQAHSMAASFANQDSSTMRISSLFFTPEHRHAASAMFAFFRTADNLVDESRISLEQFREWQQKSRLPMDEQTDPFMIAWSDIRTHYKIPLEYEQAIFDALELDLFCHRYETLDDLKKYCYGVAVSPLLLSMSIVGFRSGVTLEQAKPYMEYVGMAVQLTDIIRDVGNDLSMGRIYLPKAELAAFGLTFDDIEAKRNDARFKRCMQHFCEIARNYYAAGWPILDLYADSFRLAGGCGMIWNRSLLDEIERFQFDVFTGVKIPTSRRLWFLATKWPTIYWPKLADKYFYSKTRTSV